ncbi:MAG: gephyrin-like molybdotransferase Glp [Granulosicoccus sp.]
MIEKQPSCDDTSEPELLPVSVARERLFKSLKPRVLPETISLTEAFDRVLASDIVSTMNVPSQSNSAMDGYAISAISIPDAGEAVLDLKGTAWAGKPFEGTVATGEAVRIFTGAILPAGADTVVIQEHVRDSGAQVAIDSEVIAGKNVRHAGEDIKKGQSVLSAGRKLEAADVGVIASLGIASVDVFRPLKVAYFTTGDELCSLGQHPPGQSLSAGMLFDSNRHTLACLLQSMGVEAIDLGIVRDNEQDTRDALERAASCADVIITSGGVSAGEADFVTRVFHELGSVSFWKLAMRPGRPLAFGSVGEAAFFGLPGNPVAVMVTFLEFVKPAIRYLSGMDDVNPVTLPAISESTLRKPHGRVEYQRGILRVNSDGILVVASTGKQGAGRLSSMSKANCLIVIDAHIDGVKPGDKVGVQPFHGLLDG